MKNKMWKILLLTGGLVLLSAGCINENKKICQQADKDLEVGAYDAARQGYDTLISAGEYLKEAYRGLGIVYFETGEYLKASDAFQSALSQDDLGFAFERDVLLYQAAACYKEEMYEKGEEACKKALEMKEDVTGLFLYGKLALMLDDYDKAEESFSAAYEKDPTYDLAIEIYQAYVERSMEADGTDYLERALEKEPKKAEDYCDQGRVYYYMQDYDKAREVLTEAVNDGSEEGCLLLGDVYLAQKDVANARAMYQAYIEDAANAAKGYNGLALCDMEEGDYTSALENIEKGLRAAEDEEMQGLLFNEAVIYEKQMDFEEALKKFENYLTLYPGDEDAGREYAFLKTRI